MASRVKDKILISSEQDDSILNIESIINAMPNYVYWVDSKGVCQGCNDNVANFLGLKSRHEFAGKTYFDFVKTGALTYEQAKKFAIDDKEVIEAGVAKINEEEPPLVNTHGDLILQLTNRVPVFNDQKKVIGVIGISVDITERKKAEEELRIAKEKAEIASLAKSEFIAVVSHELRTPLNGFLGMFDYLYARPTATIEEMADVLKDMQLSGNILLTLVNDILDFSKLEAGKFEFVNTPFDLRDLIEESVNSLAVLAKQKKLELYTDYKDDLPRFVISDVKRIRQILFNLIGNAIKFTEQGHVLVSVNFVEKKKNTATVKISVQDTGVGIPKDKIDFVFEKFNQLEPGYRSENRGTGLGLSIVKKIIDNFGGKMGVESHMDDGSTFWFTIPLILQKKAKETSIENKFPKDMHIWIIDDNPMRAKVMHDQLPIKSIRILTSQQALLSLNLDAKTLPPQVIIIDDEIQSDTPETLLKHIKANQIFNDAKIILSTNPILYIQKEEAKKLGFIKCLVKPIQPTELLSALQKICAEQKDKDKSNSQQLKKLSRKIRALLVEDNLINQKVAYVLLHDLGCEVIVVDDGFKALKLLKDEKFDLIFLDIGLQGMDGYDIAEAIRKLQNANKRKPIIAMTAHVAEEDKHRCFEVGMDDIVFKPVDLQTLRKVVERWI